MWGRPLRGLTAFARSRRASGALARGSPLSLLLPAEEVVEQVLPLVDEAAEVLPLEDGDDRRLLVRAHADVQWDRLVLHEPLDRTACVAAEHERDVEVGGAVEADRAGEAQAHGRRRERHGIQVELLP